MTKAEREELDQILIAMAEIFDKKLSEMQLDLYFESLKDLRFEDVKRAANTLAKSCKFFPKPVEFRDLILPNLATEASLAYDKAYKAICSAGHTRSVIFDDPVIHAVISSLGGWVDACVKTDEERKWWRKDFERLYMQYAPRISQLSPPAKLLGTHEVHNRAGGYESFIKPPALIGDQRKALGWTSEINKREPMALAEQTGKEA